MPLLNRNSEIPTVKVRFVREGGVVAYPDLPTDTHLDIAMKYGLGQLNRSSYKLTIDGAGYMKKVGEKIELSAGSTGSILRKSPAESRADDAEVIKRITGKEVIF
jgi:hypothetical protein